MILSTLMLFSPALAVGCYVAVLWFGFSETGPTWLVLVFFLIGTFAGLYTILYLLMWLSGAVDFNPIIRLEINQ